LISAQQPRPDVLILLSTKEDHKNFWIVFTSNYHNWPGSQRWRAKGTAAHETSSSAKSAVELKLDMTKDTINRHAGLTKMQQDLNALVVKVEGQRICVNRRWYGLTVSEKRGCSVRDGGRLRDAHDPRV
jgi:hypothetical protein